MARSAKRLRRLRDAYAVPGCRPLPVGGGRGECRQCGTVKTERLEFLADNPCYTKRFAYYVGRRCRQATIKDIAEELHLDWDTVKTLEQQDMRAQLAQGGP